ncbi:MAG TPA: hypothetical protein VF482_11965 [Trebonia sp.]
MATDLDRAWVINGDDLRIGLERCRNNMGSATEVAAFLLDFAGWPLGEKRWPMTRGELATRLSKALADSPVQVVDGARCYYIGTPTEPGSLAAYLVDKIDAQGTEGGHAIGLDGECSVCGGENGRHVPLAGTADGPPLPMPPDAPGVLEDLELVTAQAVLDDLAPLEDTDPAAVLRVIDWLRKRYDT